MNKFIRISLLVLLLGGILYSLYDRIIAPSDRSSSVAAPSAGPGQTASRSKEMVNGASTLSTTDSSAIETSIRIKKLTVYDIKGTSRFLSEKEQLAMSQHRAELVQKALQMPELIFVNGPTEEKQVALTFDDGPDGTITPKILDILKQYQIKASFFFVGENVSYYPTIVKRADAEGHLALNHSYTHAETSDKSEEFINEELEKTAQAIYELIGKTPALVRPPYGVINDRVVKVFQNRGEKIILWSIDTLDWSQKDKLNIVNNVMQNVRPGEIILLHCNGDKKATVEALPEIIEGLQAKGYKLVTLDALLQSNAYKE